MESENLLNQKEHAGHTRNPSEFSDEHIEWRQGEHHVRSTRYSKVPGFMLFVRSLIEVTILGLLIWLVVIHLRGSEPSSKQGAGVGVGGDAAGFVPNFPSKIITFESDNNYVLTEGASEWKRKAVQKAWAKLIPIGQGILHIPDYTSRAALSYQTPISTGTGDAFALSTYHQLHCVYMIMNDWDALRSGRNTTHMHGSDTAEHSVHIEHCFDFLRQAVTCFGDSTLEGQASGVERNGTSGWGKKHVCRNWDALGEFAVQNRATDDVGIQPGD